MKRLLCEMCGSQELIKQNGVFVCQMCGTQYTVEEAKKMMIEGVVEVQGNVQIQNAAQLDNLLNLAHSSFDSKNYAQAESFCNQVISIDASCYDAWKLKGEAINYQITGTNDRITEVYNCIMTSYEVLDEEGQDEHREEILKSLRVCLEGEIDFVLDLIKTNRPTASLVAKVKKTFISCAANVITSYEKLGYSEEEADKYRTYIKNYFIKKVNTVCQSSWNDTVFYNYYRGGFTEEYRPNREIFKTFIEEGDYLIELLTFAEEYFTPETPPQVKIDNYNYQGTFQNEIRKSASYKRMVSTTTNGYGAVTNRREYWDVDHTLTAQAKSIRNSAANKAYDKRDAAEREAAKSDPALRKKLIDGWNKELFGLNESFTLSNVLKHPGFIVMSIGAIIGLIVACMAETDVWTWIGYAWLGIFALIAICIFFSQVSTENKRKNSAQARGDYLRKKIRDIS